MKVDKLVKNVYETIMASGMICQGDSVVVGVSGGADSVCLLSVLKNLQMSMTLQLTAVHILMACGERQRIVTGIL